MSETVKVQWTAAYQHYYSAGDDSEAFCDKCEYFLKDDYKYCPLCGSKLDWGEYEP